MLIPRIEALEAPEAYIQRQQYLASLSTGVSSAPCEIEYTAEEHATWARAQALLGRLFQRYVAPPVLVAQAELDLPADQIPQLSMVSERLSGLTGFRYASVPGTVPGTDFFAALAQQVFSSTQFIRWSGSPSYTPEPDVLHEVGGHAIALANPQLAELHRLAGLASVVAPSMLSAIAAVFWYSIEFGVVADDHGWKAYGTGLLSSPGELAWFADNAQIRPLDIGAMITTPYDLNTYQPTLFGAESLDEVVEVVGGYYLGIIRRISPSLDATTDPTLT